MISFFYFFQDLILEILNCISEEFVAHSSNVNCLSLGHKSGRVLVTGGDDKKVNLWAVGKPNCIMVRDMTTSDVLRNMHQNTQYIRKLGIQSRSLTFPYQHAQSNQPH